VEETLFSKPQEIVHAPAAGPVDDKERRRKGKQFLHDVVRSIEGSGKVLVVGPSTAKLEFLRYARKHDAKLAKSIVGIETVDHHADGQLSSYARTYFARKE
jgi:stalled ribosome rescue protein Dom34